jgi:hypothetical protein
LAIILWTYLFLSSFTLIKKTDKMKKMYVSPGVKIQGVALEVGVAQTVGSPIHSVTVEDWDNDITVGVNEAELGDIWIAY